LRRRTDCIREVLSKGLLIQKHLLESL